MVPLHVLTSVVKPAKSRRHYSVLSLMLSPPSVFLPLLLSVEDQDSTEM
jgi:hypothetical protein